MPVTEGAYEWWNGSTWVAAETYVSHTDASQFVLSQSQWGDPSETYDIAVSVEDNFGGRSAYTANARVNPMEWWDGSAWVSTETYISHTDIDSIDIPASSFTAPGTYDWTVSVEDSGGLVSDYAAERSLSLLLHQILGVTAIPSSEAWGTPVMAPGLAPPIQPSGVGSSEFFGLPNIHSTIVTSPGSIVSAEAFGTPNIYQLLRIQPGGIGSAEAFGTPLIIPGMATVSSAGAIASGQSFGLPVIVPGPVAIAPSSIASLEAAGTPTIIPGPVAIMLSGIVSAEALGMPTIYSFIRVSPAGIASAEASGVHTVHASIVVAPSSILSAEALGTPTIIPGMVIISPPGIATGELFGTPLVIPPGKDWINRNDPVIDGLRYAPAAEFELIDTKGYIEMLKAGTLELRNTHGFIIILDTGDLEVQ